MMCINLIKLVYMFKVIFTEMMATIGAVGDYDSVETAALLVDKALQSDMSYLDMCDLLQVPRHSESFFNLLLSVIFVFVFP